MKVLEEEDKGSCYDMASLDKMASLTSLTDERPNKPSTICTLRSKHGKLVTYSTLQHILTKRRAGLRS